jgi:hypothetical protein
VPGSKLGENRRMKMNYNFGFEVGTLEKHSVAFHWGQWWGLATISVDGVEVHHERHNFSPNKLTRIYEVTVGTSEPHAVRIEKTREAHFAGFRRHTFKAFVDGELVGEY